MTIATLAVLSCLSRIARRLLFFGHLLQLEGYKPGEYVDWLRSHVRDAVVRKSHLSGAVALVGLYFGLSVLALEFPESGFTGFFVLGLAWLTWAGLFSSSGRFRRDRLKKPLVFTARMRRIGVVAIAISIVLIFLPHMLFRADGPWMTFVLTVSGLYLADLFAPASIGLAVVALEPLEATIRNGFKQKARGILANAADLDIIAITGSYGKTSVKFAVQTVLAHRFDVLATPGSFNTPMGICRVINNSLAPQNRVLILEMGMRHPGDIAELCDIARPDIALITSVGVAHLDSMGSIEAIAAEKASLLSFVRDGGSAVLNGDDERVLRMADSFAGRSWIVATKSEVKADISAMDIDYGPTGSSFAVRDESGESALFQTRLLGLHNVTNILMAVAVGRIYGLRLRQIQHAVTRLSPVPHRLELKQDGQITVIDDAFNSNPVGARNAVEILGRFTTGKRVIVTPGMIELGDEQEAANRTFGKQIAAAADMAILVGRAQTKSIADGLREAGFPDDSVRVVSSLFEAQDFIRNSLSEGDIVLYENDLPDQFNES
ncbi:MAG: UDP-N-acetylmuramoyl-tripeptide--D-alanyl-D-alanine ligase [Bacteroidetes bacterium]|nr:MAG: UDP-N-acetylmuramoyl-tripeptide--D-alanyl-D-alanine ligase [Bacteroidota bacterium]